MSSSMIVRKMENISESAIGDDYDQSFGFKDNLRYWRVFIIYHTVVLICIILVDFSGNILTLTALLKFKYLRTKQNALIGSLCISDICVGICIIGGASTTLYSDANNTDGFATFTTTSVFISIAHMVMNGINRFIAVVVPLRYSTLVTKKTIMAFIVASWMSPIVLLLPIYCYAMTVESSGRESYIRRIHRMVVLGSSAIVGMLFSILYGTIIRQMRKRMRIASIIASTNRRGLDRLRNRKGHKWFWSFCFHS